MATKIMILIYTQNRPLTAIVKLSKFDQPAVSVSVLCK